MNKVFTIKSLLVTTVFVTLSGSSWAFDENDYDLIYSPAPSSSKIPSAPSYSAIDSEVLSPVGTKKKGWFLNFDDLVATDNLDPQSDRVMLKKSANKTVPYIKSNARRKLASSTKVKAALRVLGNPSIWTDSSGLNTKGRSLLEFIAGSEAKGLMPSDYNTTLLDSGLSGDELEFAASKLYAHVINDILLGRLDVNLADYDWHIKQDVDQHSVKSILSEAMTSDDIASTLEAKFPQHAMYRGLIQALANFQSQANGTPSFPAAGPKLQIGTTHRHVGLLRTRLGLFSGGNTMDAELKVALQAFQTKNGLNSDGVVGRRTRVALSKGVAGRIMQIKQTLERLRWLPNVLPQKYIFVSTAGYELNLRENDQTLMTMRTVVGQKRRGVKNHETPSFSKNMKYLVINPKWNVPASIMSKEFLAKAQKDPGFFKKGNYTVFSSKGAKIDPYSVDWNKYVKGEKIPYRAVQGEGNSNALGRIKFMLPNKYSIYLHDTPSKSLFKKERRSFSHGCVRLEQPVQLATTLLGKSTNEVKSLISSGKNQTIYLDKQLPVFIAYITAWARDDGTVIFFDDYYGHDKRMKHNFKGT